MIARPNLPLRRALRGVCVSLAVTVFGLSAAAGYAHSSPAPPPDSKDNAKKKSASDDKKASKGGKKKASKGKRASRKRPKRGSGRDRRRGTRGGAKRQKKASKPDSAERAEPAESEDSTEESDRAEKPAIQPPDAAEEPDAAEQDAKKAEGEEKAPGEPLEQEVDSELRKRIDDLLEPGAEGDSQPGVRDGADGRPSGPTTTLNIPPTEEAVPPEERMYSFSIKDGTYAQLIESVARLTGLGVIGEAPRDGKVSFVTEQELTFDELIARVRMLLANYKPHDPYTLIRADTHLQVVRVADYYRDLPRERMYRNVEEYQAAGLTEYELALVLYTPDSGSVAALSVIRDFMPDYVRVTPLEDRNALTIFAFVKHIEKYLELIPIFVGTSADPRELAVIEVKHIIATDAVEKLRTLMDLDENGSRRRRTATPKGRGGQRSPLAGIPEPEVSVVPNDAQGVIVVRAMPAKIDEMRLLLPYIDVDTSESYDPVMIRVKHADPVELVSAIEQVLGAGGSSASARAPRKSGKSSRKKRRRPKSVPPVTLGDITLLPHPSISAILVMADDEDVARVRRLAEMFDVEEGVSHLRIELQYADANEFAATVTQLLGAGGPKGTVPEDFDVVPDPSGKAIWYSGSEKNLAKVREILAAMDTADEVVSLHITRLVNQSPSFVAGILAQYDRGGGGGSIARPPARGKKKRKTSGRSRRPSGTGKFTADDDQGRLYVLCTDEQWKEYLAVIEQLESEATVEKFVVIPVKHLTADEAISKVTGLLNETQVAKLRFETMEDGFVVIGASEADLATIRALLDQLDREVEIVQRTFEIHHVDPAEMSSMVRTLVSEEPSRSKPRRPGGSRARGKGKVGSGASRATASDDLTIVELGKFLIVRTTPEKMERVAELIAEFDVKDEKREIREYADFPPGTDLEHMAHTLASLLSSGRPTGAKGRQKGPARAEKGPRIIARPASRRLVVIARLEDFEEIEELLQVIRDDSTPQPIEVSFVEVKYADPDELVGAIEPLLEMRVEQMISTGELVVTEATVAVGPRAPKAKKVGSARPGRGKNYYHMAADERKERIVMMGPQTIIDAATKLIAQFDVAIDRDDPIVITFVPVEHSDPADLIELVEPLLSMKVDELIRMGTLTEPPARAPAGPRGAKGAKRRKGAAKTAPRGDQRFHMDADGRNRRIVLAAPQVVVDEAVKLIAEFDRPIDVGEPIVIAYVPVVHTDPADLVDQIDPLLSMKVDELIRAGLLTETSVDVPAKAGSARGSRGKKGGAARKGRSDKRYHLAGDERNSRIVVAAPQVVVDEATRLIAEFDQPAEMNVDFRTVELENADPSDMVKAIRELMGAGGRARSGKGGKTGGTSALQLAGSKLTVAEAPGGGSLILRGPTKDVEQALEWIAHLDEISGSGREIKVYEIKRADIKRLVDLIMHDVDRPGKAGQKRAARPRRKLQEPAAEEEFTTTLERVGTDLYIQADLIDRTLVVSAPPSKLARVDDIIAEFDSEDGPGIAKPPVPKMFYELKHTEAIDASFDLEMVLEALWDPPDELPKVDYAPFDEVLIVKYPDESRFPEIEELIAKYVDKPKPEDIKIARRAVPVPDGWTAKELSLWIKMNYPEHQIELIDTTPPEDTDYGVQELEPYRQQVSNKVAPCVRPLAFGRMTAAALATIPGQTKAGESNDETQDVPESKKLSDTGTTAGKEESPAKPDKDALPANVLSFIDEQSERLKVYYDDITGAVIIEGKAGILEDVDDWMDVLKEELEDLPTPPDIRILQVRHIDVYKAQEIINEMFNATRQQRQMWQQQQRRAQQMARQQQMRQRQQQQQQQQRGQQQPGQPGQQGGRRRQQAGQQQVPVAPLPAETVRIYPNPRDRTLIVRADTSQFHVIKRLLATIDRPQPIESSHRVFQLKKLNAVDVEELLKDWLGVDASQARTRPRTTQPRGRGGRGAARPAPVSTPGGHLPRPIMQDSPTAGPLGIDPRDIKITSNEATNTILVMAPKAALDYVEELINDLENQEIAERIWKSYELKYAEVEEVVEFLSSRFGQGGTTPQRRGAKGARDRQARKKTAAAPATSPLNTATFIAYPALSLISAQATEEQLTEIDELIAQLDVPTAGEDFKTVALSHADAQAVADTLTKMFGKGGGGRPGRKGGRSAPETGPGPKFIGEEGGKVVFFSAAERLHPRIREVIAKLEDDATGQRSVRIIELQHAKPSAVAEAIQEAYGGTSRKGRRRSGKGRSTGTAGITVTGNDAAKRLFVMADDATFAEIESLAKTLDVDEEIGFDFRVYKLEHASARTLYETLNKLVTDFMRAKGREGTEIEPFAVEVDDKANALIVLGGEVVFEFVENALKTVDTPANAASPPGFYMVALKSADAQEVAQNITRLWNEKTFPSGELPPQVEANTTLNVLIVRGTREQIEEIKTRVIEPLEEQTPPLLLTESIKLAYADPWSVQDAINQLFRGMGKKPRDQVTAVPEWGSRSVIVSASPENMERVKALVAEIDAEDASRLEVHVMQLENADADSVSQTLNEIFIRSAPRAQGNQGAAISISALRGSKAILVKCNSEDYAEIEAAVAELDREGTVIGEEVRIVTLLYGDATEVRDSMQEYLRKPGGGGRGAAELAGDVRLSVLTQTNAVVVSGDKGRVEQIEALIRSMDAAGEKGSVPQIIPLKYVNVSRILPSLEEMFEEARGRGKRSQAPPVIVANENLNVLVVRGGPTDVTAIQAIVAQLDTEEAGDKPNFLLIKVATGINVEDLAEKVETSINEGAKAQAGDRRGSQVPSITVTPDRRTNSLMVSGTPTLFAEAEQLVRAMEEIGPAGGSTVRILRLGSTPADEVVRLIEQLKGEGSSKKKSRTSRGGRRPSRSGGSRRR